MCFANVSYVLGQGKWLISLPKTCVNILSSHVFTTATTLYLHDKGLVLLLNGMYVKPYSVFGAVVKNLVFFKLRKTKVEMTKCSSTG